MEAENDHDFETVLATFRHPRYELMATGHVFDGEQEVREYFRRSRAAVPDQRNEHAVLHDAGDLVVAEFDLVGTAAATGRAFRAPMVALFFFEGDGITCERVFWDRKTVEAQVGDGREVGTTP
jgi:ketosteroid isomerase-like protein